MTAHFAGIYHQLEDMQVAVIRAGLPEQDKRRREEMGFIHNFCTVAPDGLNQHFSFYSRDLRARTLTCFKILKFSAMANSLIFPDEGSIAEMTEFYLQLSAFNLPPSHFHNRNFVF